MQKYTSEEIKEMLDRIKLIQNAIMTIRDAQTYIRLKADLGKPYDEHIKDIHYGELNIKAYIKTIEDTIRKGL